MELMARVDRQLAAMARNLGPHNPFLAWGTFLRSLEKQAVQKLSLNVHPRCPNRQGDGPGCSWCRPESFLPGYCNAANSPLEQLHQGMAFFGARHPETAFLAFFQGYTTGGAEGRWLQGLCRQILSADPRVRGLVLATRPDALEDGLIKTLAELSATHFVMVEVGLESFNDRTLQDHGRGCDTRTAIEALRRLEAFGIPAGIHLIMGLPGDSRQELAGWADLVSELPVRFLKLHHLQVLSASPLARRWQEHPGDFELFGLDEYLEFCIGFLQRLRPGIVLDRFTNESPPDMVLAPRWEGVKNQEFAKRLHRVMDQRQVWQGKLHGVR